MIHDDFNFSFESSDFPVSIEEFAAYMDGNLSDVEMQRIGSVIDNDEMMQGVMDSMEQSEQTLTEYGQEDMQLPEEIYGDFFTIPKITKYVQEHIHNHDRFYTVAAFAPMEDDSVKKKNNHRMPPQVLDDDNQ